LGAAHDPARHAHRERPHDQVHLRPHFIKTHRRELGAVGKRNFVYEQERAEKDRIASTLTHDLRQTISRGHTIAQIGAGKILGKGGRRSA